jgi:tyrosyl-tRNA synthetase
LQTGGSDQWGNLVSGIDLIHKVEGAAVHAIGTPLITNSDGTKFGKTEGNAVWLDPALTSPYAFYQFWLNTKDADVVDRLKVFTFLPRSEIEDLGTAVAERPAAREAQRRLAWEVTATVHGDDAADAARDASQALFGGGDLERVDEATLEAALAELPNAADGEPEDPVGALLVRTRLVTSLSEGRRAVAQGGVYVNNDRITSADGPPATRLHGRFVVLRRGKRNLAVVRYPRA